MLKILKYILKLPIKFFRKLRLRTQIALGISAVLLPIIFAAAFWPGAIDASWWNDNWLYRQRIDFTNSGSADSDKYVTVTFDSTGLVSNGKMQADCSDVRFTDTSGNELTHERNIVVGSNTSVAISDGADLATHVENTLGSRYVFRNSSGNLYAVMGKVGVSEDVISVYKSSDGSTWSPQDTANEPDETQGNNDAVSATMDSSGIIHIIWYVGGVGAKYSTYNTSTDQFNGGAAATEEAVHTEVQGTTNPYVSITVDSSDIPHVSFVDGRRNQGADFDTIHYANRVGGAWNAAVEVEINTNDKNNRSPEITINDENVAEIVYYNSTDFDVTAALGNANNATSFTLHDVDATTSTTAYRPSIAVNSDGDTWIAYVDSGGTLTIADHPDESGWTTGWTTYTTSDTAIGPSLAIDGSDVYILYENGSNQIAYNKYTGSFAGETQLETAASYQDVKAKWTYLNNYNSSGNAGLKANTYYFDNSDSCAAGSSCQDPQSVWTSDSNAFDGSTSTSATSSTGGSTSSNYLRADGTTAPGSGGTIQSVKARIYANVDSLATANAAIYTDGLGELLGTAVGPSGFGPTWGSYTTLSTPTGGWTWAKVQALETKIYLSNTPLGTPGAFMVEIQVESGSSAVEVDYLFSDGTDIYWNKLPTSIDTTGECNATDTSYKVLLDDIAGDDNYFYMYYGNNLAQSRYAGDGTIAVNQFTPSAGPTFNTEELGPVPIANWKMDEATDNSCKNGTDDVCDSTAQQNDLNKTNAIWVDPSTCIKGNCISFDGNGDYLQRADDSDFDYAAADSFTISGWFKHPTISTNPDYLIAKHESGTAGGYKVYMDSDGDLVFAIDDDGTWEPEDSVGGSLSANYDDNQWHHFTAVKNGTTGIYLYIDGKLVDSDTSLTATGTLANAETLNVGNDMDEGTNGWEGFLDEVRVYKYARAASDIATESSLAALVLGVNTESKLNTGLIGHWDLDNVLTDSSGNGYNLTNNGSTPFIEAKFADGSDHTSGSSQHFSYGSTINGVKSVSFWVNPDNNTNYYISLTSSAYITSITGILSATGFTNPRIFVDGIESTTIAAGKWQFVTVTTDTAINADTFYIGRQGSNHADAIFDEVRLYNRKLDPSDINNIYSWGPSAGVYYEFNENNGDSTAYDSSGNGYNATLTNVENAHWVPAKFGSGINFDGTSYATSSEGANLSTNKFAAAAWIKRNTDTGGIETIIDNRDADNDGVRLLVNASDQAECAYNSTDVTGTTALAINTWYYITCTSDGSTMKVYVNAQLDNSGAITGDVAETANLRVGATSFATITNFFDGIIDETRYYNYERSSSQVIEDMNAGHPLGGSPITSKAVEWKFDESYGSSVYDSAGNNSTGTASNTSWLARSSCKFGKCLDFSGSESAAATLATASDAEVDFNGTESFTASAWIYITTMPGSSTQRDGIITKWDATTLTRAYRLYITDSDIDNLANLNAEIIDESNDQSITASTTNEPLSTNTWYHVSMTFNGGTSGAAGDVKLYINGKFESQNAANASFAGMEDVTADFVVGDYDTDDVVADNPSFTGYIDEVKIYSSALTADQLKIDYNQSSAINFGGGNNEADDITGGAGAAPIAYWNFNENTASTAFDTSINSNNGTLTNMNNQSWVPGVYGSALYLQGNNNRHVFVPHNATLSFGTGSFTISVWVKREAKASGDFIVAKRPAATAGYALSWVSDGTLRFGIDDDATSFPEDSATTTAAYDDGEWHHVVGVKNSTDSIQIYVDGILRGQDISTSADGSLDNTGDLYIGMEHASASLECEDCTLDEVKIFNYALSAAQIAYDYNRGAPMGWWKLDECQGSIANDSSGSRVNGTITTGTGTIGTCTGSAGEMWFDGATGKRNSSLDFNSTESEYVDIGDTTLTTVRTVSFWAKPDTTTEQFLQLSATDTVQVSSGTMSIAGFGTETVYIDGKQTTTFPDTNWHHVTVVSDTDITANDMDIGRISTNYGDGLIDDVRIYNYALSVAQIRKVYNNGAVFFGPTEGTP